MKISALDLPMCWPADGAWKRRQMEWVCTVQKIMTAAPTTSMEVVVMRQHSAPDSKIECQSRRKRRGDDSRGKEIERQSERCRAYAINFAVNNDLKLCMKSICTQSNYTFLELRIPQMYELWNKSNSKMKWAYVFRITCQTWFYSKAVLVWVIQIYTCSYI